MSGYVVNIEQETVNNGNFRKVLYRSSQSVSGDEFKGGEDIGEEVHDVDQFLRIEEGEGKTILDGEESVIASGFAVVVPAGVKHNIINTSADKEMKIYTVYSPSQHRDGTIHVTKEEAEKDEHDQPA